MNKMTAPNERSGATATGSANLRGSVEMPPLRQAAIQLFIRLGLCSRILKRK